MNDKNTPLIYIKDVAIQLRNNFNFDNLPHDENNNSPLIDKKPFIGRQELIDKFVQMLKSERGIYLVTGYRGMGKTSFVNQVLLNYNSNKTNPLKSIKITITQNNPTELEILKLIVSTLNDECENIEIIKKRKFQKKLSNFFAKLFGILFTSLFFLFLLGNENNKFIRLFTLEKQDSVVNSINKTINNKIKLLEKSKKTSLPVAKNIDSNHVSKIKTYTIQTKLTKKRSNNYIIILNNIFKIMMFISFLILILSLFIHLYLKYYSEPLSIYNRLNQLFKKSHANVSFEDNDISEVAFEAINAKITQGGHKRTESYPISSSKEIEYELTNIINSLRKYKKFVFIVDELDKVETIGIKPVDSNYASIPSSYEKVYLEQLRGRKQIIQQVIAGLKNFYTTTKSPFIFIAGREMFEASMADISDRQSSISSIFSYVFYIESLLKENIIGSGSLSKGIENYLFWLIHGREPTNDESIYEINDGNYRDINDAIKVNLMLQNLVVYLTYRSNGSPKKLIRLVHEFIKVENKPYSDTGKIALWENEKTVSNVNKDNLDNFFYYLYFDYSNQQRISFISYLYRPFLVKYGSSFKKYSDNLIVSTSYLFDHLLKFHPFAFSNNHLELVPEVLSTNRTPALRDHIKKIIDYLMLNHVRETEIGLFEYKFYSKTVNEIFYLSKTFEEESAAFNFTLDESYLTKMHVMVKLRELRIIYDKHFENQSGNSGFYSIAYLNGVLGDLHFFDQEYDDSIIAYSDGIGALPPFKDIDRLQDFVLLLKFKLKLGLSFEKIKSFEESLSLYSDASRDVRYFISSLIKKSTDDCKINNSTNFNLIASLNDLMQVANQAFLAELVLHEKMGVEGITAMKNNIIIGQFLSLIDLIAEYCGRNTTILSNFFLQIGVLFYLKNSIKGFEWELYKNNNHVFIPTEYYKDIEDALLKNKRYVQNESHRQPFIAITFYSLGLKYLLIYRIDNFSEEFNELGDISLISSLLSPKQFKKHDTSLSKIHFRYIGIYLSNIGDCMFSMLVSTQSNKDIGFNVEDIFSRDFLKIVIKNLNLNSLSPEGKIIDILDLIKEFYALESDTKNSAREVIYYYFLSAYYFQKSGRYRSFSFQLRKILYFFRLVLVQNQDKIITCLFLKFLDEIIVKSIISLSSFNAEFSDIHDYNKFIDIFKGHTISKNDISKVLRNNISNFSDPREAITLYNHIKIRLSDLIYEDLVKQETFNSNYLVSTQYYRLIELTYAAKLYENKIKKLTQKIFKKGENFDSILESDCIGYILSLSGIIKIIDIYDNDYLVGSSFLAYHYYRMAYFFTNNEIDNTKNMFDIKMITINEIKRKISEKYLTEKHDYTLFDPLYNYEMAAKHYNKAINLHSTGSEYKNALSDIHYLEDDLNDASYHFGAAMDRYLMINGKLSEYYRLSKVAISKFRKGKNDFM